MAATLGFGTARLVRGHALSPLRRQFAGGAGGARRPSTASTLRPRTPPGAARDFSSGPSGQRPRFSQRLGDALRKTKVTWYHIPVGLGVGFLGLVQFYKVQSREREKQDGGDRPKPRPRIQPEGPWQVQVMSTLPLKAISRLWGQFNELTIPYYLRVPGFKLYSWVFGVNLSEVSEPDLHVYPNLAAFFYRTLKPGARPLDPDPQVLLSPSDGKVLQFGQIDGGNIEQVKGMTYTVDALLGKHTPSPSLASGTSSAAGSGASTPRPRDDDVIGKDEEFARVNGISYTLPDFLTGHTEPGEDAATHRVGAVEDQSTQPSPAAVSEVRADLALNERAWYDLLPHDKTTSLYYAVIYLAPGDYHRFHSPAAWVVERRRHFAGELYSVSPYLQRTLPGLFTLNERVALLGRWRWGFFAYVPVGATNVGSIRVHFDAELRTNSLLTDTAADRAAAEAARDPTGEPYLGFAEATYAAASPVLGGHALRRGEEMGGFQLGSTIVLVFEAPTTAAGKADEKEGEKRKGWEWKVEKGQTIKMGQALGRVNED
ncbi:phosphatidylserine decarboxylase proenzyme 1 [Cordyceps fumosorosea ARSEF 2679]|uniref:Phosphatidylserine decarboxylase proenzyme 1, mitochondrial n=1 Tax=Cordyceps fumosorosea (strain ARSEF 2679) TaxID=1081104 RepID=A0A167YCP1_CORFA|nr:phosphatidylserine decarboxylase proenzyme 1 [Cordyceps fumosorosea ARSEF 2679]OAA66173.1 phosphatidylserine decarboxylase proenzyme 1 [Cordyceps fumosorosea ARSEF 2679]